MEFCLPLASLAPESSLLPPRSRATQLLAVMGWIILMMACPPAAVGDEMIHDGPRSVINLAGEWDVLPIKGITFDFPPPKSGWIKEQVPAASSVALRAEKTPYTPPVAQFLAKDKSAFIPLDGYAGWFKRSFDLPEAVPGGRRAKLFFEGMAFKSEIWLNGKKLGESMLGHVPQSYDVTEVLRAGKNELIVGLAGRPALIDVARQTFLAPASGVNAGLWGDVKLQFVPELHFGKIFVNTSVKDQRIRFDVHVTNASESPREFSVNAVIVNSRQEPQTQLASPKIKLNPGESRKIAVEKDWIAPELWSPANPALYFAKLSLDDGSALTDMQTLRFGFREFEIRGRDFYLNGVRTTLLRESPLRSLTANRADIFAEVRNMAGQPYNCIRLHLGFNSQALLDLCDELGVMTIPESAWHNIGNKFSVPDYALWLPNLEKYTREFMELYYNHPSVVMWSLTNETFWGDTDDVRMAVADRLVEVAREVDPDRPLDGDAEVAWGGRLPVISIHYPESSVGNSLREKYPRSASVFPNDMYWLSKDKENVSWRAKFQWDRPLIIGEYWYPAGDVDSKSSFMGESIYDWEKWRYQRLDGRDDEDRTDNDYVRIQKALADAYRIQGVAGLNPWASDGRKVMPPIAVRPVDFHPNFFGGASASRKFVIFNDSGRSFHATNLQCRLEANGRTLWEKIIPVGVTPGQTKEMEIVIDAPQVLEPVEALLTVRLRHERGNNWMQLYRYEEPVFIMPRPDLSGLDASKIRLLAQGESTAKAFAALGLNLTAQPAVTSEELTSAKLVIIGEETDAMGSREALAAFAEQGGSVLVLRPEAWRPLVPELPDIDKEHVSTRSWRRTFDHPVTKGMADLQFSYWRPDHLVSIQTFIKPSSGAFRSILDAGGSYGLRWSPLVEIPLGEGTFLLTSLDLVAKSGVEPAAAQLLANLVRYGLDFTPAKVEPLRLLVSDNLPLHATLAAAGVATVDGLPGGTGPILVDASFKPSGNDLKEVKAFLEGGGNVWLHGFDSSNIGAVASLFPFNPVLKPFDETVQTAARRSEDLWMNGLSSFDFFWSKVDLEARRDFFELAQPTAPLGGGVLQLPNVQAGELLIEPGLLVKVPSGKGHILFDTLAWENALGVETDKVTRIAASLAANLGAEVHSTVEKTQYDYTPINIAPQVNMGYYDAVADDGKGGWTDQGENDMRFFLINHLGRAGGLESGMEIEAQVWPDNVLLADRPFWLLDARETGVAVISLRGQDNGTKLPSSAKGIQVNRKADKLWFLQGAGWTPPQEQQEVTRYVIHYADGEQEVFPIRYGVEISEWWKPRPISGARVAWTGRNLKRSPIGIYATEWSNPFPDKEIASIDMIGDLSPTQVVLMGITAGSVVGEGTGELLSQWKLSAFDGTEVPNLVVDASPLLAGNPAPVEVSEKGLRIEGGQRLHVSSKSLPRMGGFGEDSQPFALRTKFSPSDLPSGHFGGIFQAAEYNKSGFRLMLNRELKVVVEIFDGEKIHGIKSRSPLEVGRSYEVELRFDGNYVTLLIDGQTEVINELAIPPAFQGEVLVGRASGEDYFFNGTIQEISLIAL